MFMKFWERALDPEYKNNKEETMGKIKILVINGSPRKDGITMSLAKYVISSAKKSGAEIEIIHLIDKKIKPCEGCVSKNPKECNRDRCKELNDDIEEIFNKFMECDGVLFVSPVYWYSPSALMKNLIDRLTALENEGKLLDGKVGGFVVTAQEDGAMMTILTMMGTLNDMGFIFPPYAFTYSVGFEKVEEDKEAITYAERLGKNMVELIEIVKKRKWV